MLFEKDTTATQKVDNIQMSCPLLSVQREQMLLFQESLNEQPTAVFWSIFPEMSDILHRFIYYQREGDWVEHLSDSANATSVQQATTNMGSSLCLSI